MSRDLLPLDSLARPDAEQPPRPRLSDHIRRLRWQVPLAALLLVLAHQIAEHFWLALDDTLSFGVEIVVYGLVGPAIVWLALGWVQRKVVVKEAAEAELVQAHAELTRLTHRIGFLLRASERLGEIADEAALAELALKLPGEAVPAVVACALIRFDEHRQPMPVEYRGDLDEPALASWHRHLTSQAVQMRCQTCHPRTARRGEACALFDQLPLASTDRVVCLPLERGDRQFAILGLFLASGQNLTPPEHDLLSAVAAEIALAFENIRLRTHELTTLYEINETLHLRLDFDGLMARLLTRTMEASHADAGLLLLREADGSLVARASAGDWQGGGQRPLVEGLAAGALRDPSGEPVVANLQTADQHTACVMVAPMVAEAGPLGVIVLGSRQPDAFLRQQTRLVATIAGQAALLAENARLYAQIEHQAILAERGRLAREMHDGLAQTLGYLKMRAGQIGGWIDKGQPERARDALRELAQTANDAYIDLRATLDGLRTPLDAARGAGFGAQMRRLASTFEAQSGLKVDLALDAEPSLSASAQAHLLSVVQESLTNVRKHAQARTVLIRLTQSGDHLSLAIDDDGRGFDAGRDLPDTCHGLRVMRERADLLGADLQVISAPGDGTRVRVEWTAAPASAY